VAILWKPRRLHRERGPKTPQSLGNRKQREPERFLRKRKLRGDR
jgi:hypothetical protein